MELLVKLLEENTLDERPPRRLPHLVYIPPFRHYAILDHSRIGYERIDTITHHDRNRIAVMDGRGCMFFLFGTRQHPQGCRQERESTDGKPHGRTFPRSRHLAHLYYSTFHFMNHRSLNVMPMLMRNVFSVMNALDSERTHCPLMLRKERLL